MRRITVIIPTLNEEKGIGPTIKEYMETIPNAEVMVIDGGSSDKTVEIAKGLGAEVIINEGGKGSAIAKALSILQSRDTEPDYLVFTDGDYTYPAKHVPEMIKVLSNDLSAGAVLGDRFKNHGILHYFTNIYFMGNLIIKQFYKAKGIKLNDPLTGLRTVRWSAIKDWIPTSKEFEIETEMNLYLLSNGWKILELPIEYRKRLGEKKLKVTDAIPIIKMLINYNAKA